jgi:hypothetical protein
MTTDHHTAQSNQSSQSIERWTYYLWYGNKCIDSVRLKPRASRQDVIYKALRMHDVIPLCNRPSETPHERRNKISRARVRTYIRGGIAR